MEPALPSGSKGNTRMRRGVVPVLLVLLRRRYVRTRFIYRLTTCSRAPVSRATQLVMMGNRRRQVEIAGGVEVTVVHVRIVRPLCEPFVVAELSIEAVGA